MTRTGRFAFVRFAGLATFSIYRKTNAGEALRQCRVEMRGPQEASLAEVTAMASETGPGPPATEVVPGWGRPVTP